MLLDTSKDIKEYFGGFVIPSGEKISHTPTIEDLRSLLRSSTFIFSIMWCAFCLMKR
jgi:hypothetical protein